MSDLREVAVEPVVSEMGTLVRRRSGDELINESFFRTNHAHS